MCFLGNKAVLTAISTHLDWCVLGYKLLGTARYFNIQVKTLVWIGLWIVPVTAVGQLVIYKADLPETWQAEVPSAEMP